MTNAPAPMTRRTRLRRALTSSDAFAALGLVFLAVGAWMVAPPLGFLGVGIVLLFIARTEAK